jgi:hypothetical protein
MPVVDAAAQAGMAAQVFSDCDFLWLDFVGTPIRACTWCDDVTLAGTGDPELDGAYEAIDPSVLDIGDVEYAEGGSGTVTITLSGIVGMNDTVLNTIGDRSKWYRRTCRIWQRIHDQNGVQQGGIIAYKTGVMIDAKIVPAPDSQSIIIEVENYLSLLSGASMRTYMNQSDYDPADTSARATIAAANGAKTGPAAGVGGGSGGGGGGVARGGGGRSFESLIREP